jgi:hypothetical protein
MRPVLLFAAVALGWVGGCVPEPEPLPLEEAADSLSLETFLAHMEVLSSDAMAGRMPGTPGYDSAAAYVVREARALGLEPGGVDGTWLQPITFRRLELDPGAVRLSVEGEPLRLGPDFSVMTSRMPVEVELDAPLVFAGYGIHAPELGHDDLAGVEVEGKLVLVLPGAPVGLGSVERAVLPSAAVRDAELRARGAVGTILAWPEEGARRSTPWATMARSWARPGLRWLPPGAVASEEEADAGTLPALAVPQRVAAAWMADVGRDFETVRSRLRSGAPSSFDLDLRARLSARMESETFESPNVAALLPGADPRLADEHLVLTAHLDHVGVGIPVGGDSIYNGTLDNASGSAALLTLASVLTRMEPPRRSVLFLWLTAEESGLLGSDYFARFPTVEESGGRVVATQNMDGVMGMITEASDVLAFGYEHSNLSEAVDFAVARTGTPVSPDPTPEENLFIRSDQYAFVRQGIPAIWVQSGRTAADPGEDAQARLDRWIAERYHRPADDLEQPVDRDGVRIELRTNLLVTHWIANGMDEVRWDPESFLYRLFAEGRER